jgi:hypothetical protein
MDQMPMAGDLLFWQPSLAPDHVLLAVVLDTRKLRIVSSDSSRLDDLAMFVASLPGSSFHVLRNVHSGPDADARAFDGFSAMAFDLDKLASKDGWVDVSEVYRFWLRTFYPRLHHDHPLASYWIALRRARVRFKETLRFDAKDDALTSAAIGRREHLVAAVSATREVLRTFPPEFEKRNGVKQRIADVLDILNALDRVVAFMEDDDEARRLVVPELHYLLHRCFEDLAVAAEPNAHPRTGDLILLEPVDGSKPFNTLAQMVATRRRARFSHVAIALDQFQAVHAMPEGGVQTIMIDKLLATWPGEGFQVLRYAEVDWNDDLCDALREGILYHHEQTYNKFFLLPGNKRSSFCSELAAKAFARAQRPLLAKRPPSRVLPGHIAGLAEAEGWIDVTDQYRSMRERERSFSPWMREPLLDGTTSTEDMAEQMMRSRQKLLDIQESVHDAMSRFNEAAKKLGLAPTALPAKRISSWENDLDVQGRGVRRNRPGTKG